MCDSIIALVFPFNLNEDYRNASADLDSVCIILFYTPVMTERSQTKQTKIFLSKSNKNPRAFKNHVHFTFTISTFRLPVRDV